MISRVLQLPQRLALVALLFSTSLVAAGAGDFATIARRMLAETHAQHYQSGNIRGCVSLYAADAKFFVANKLVASGEAELLKFYQEKRDVDRITRIEIDDFVDVGSQENVGWAIFNYTKEFTLKDRDPEFIKRHKLEGFSALNVKQYGTAIFAKTNGQWKIQRMTVFDPEIWEPRK